MATVHPEFGTTLARHERHLNQSYVSAVLFLNLIQVDMKTNSNFQTLIKLICFSIVSTRIYADQTRNNKLVLSSRSKILINFPNQSHSKSGTDAF